MKVQVYVTSNNQLVCLSNHVLSRAGVAVPSGWVFDNGAVIRMRALAQGGSEIRMIHPHAVSNPQRYVSPQTFNEAMAAATLAMPPESCVYVVRHGHAAHNEPAASVAEAHDAHLTPAGMQQAADCGRAIFEDARGLLGSSHAACTLAAFSSDLFRTMQTCRLLLDHFPPAMRPSKCTVCIEARENTRPIGGVHHWQSHDPLRRVAIDPFLPLEQLMPLAPGKTREEVERMRAENLPKNDPLGNGQLCVKRLGDMDIDWGDYVAKVGRAKAEGKTFGAAASETLFLDIILRNAQSLSA